MTYRKIFDLKFKKKIPTLELEQSFPDEREKVLRVALMELPARTLRQIIRNERELDRLLLLKHSFTARHDTHS